jgi:hypothetical protein
VKARASDQICDPDAPAPFDESDPAMGTITPILIGPQP